MFIPIRPEAMVIGKRYKVGTTTGIYMKKWDAAVAVTYYKFFDQETPTLQRYQFFTDSTPFQQYVSDNPQGKMEQRSVNILVRQLTGDACFNW